MDLKTNGAKTIAALIALNAGLLFSHHLPMTHATAPKVQAKMAAHGEMCKAKQEAHLAAMQARIEARQAVREAMRARKEAIAEAAHAAATAPRTNASKVQNSVSGYVHCLVSSGVRSIVSGV